jgi:hypothetical protein
VGRDLVERDFEGAVVGQREARERREARALALQRNQRRVARRYHEIEALLLEQLEEWRLPASAGH